MFKHLTVITLIVLLAPVLANAEPFDENLDMIEYFEPLTPELYETLDQYIEVGSDPGANQASDTGYLYILYCSTTSLANPNHGGGDSIFVASKAIPPITTCRLVAAIPLQE